MKLNKKGFTLIELLAVIAILAILVVLAVPNILNLFSESRGKAYTIDAQSVYEAAQTQWQLDQFDGTSAKTYTTVGSNPTKLKNATISDAADYCVVIDAEGKVTKFAYKQAGYYYSGPTSPATTVSKSDIEVAQNASATVTCP